MIVMIMMTTMMTRWRGGAGAVAGGGGGGGGGEEETALGSRHIWQNIIELKKSKFIFTILLNNLKYKW